MQSKPSWMSIATAVFEVLQSIAGLFNATGKITPEQFEDVKVRLARAEAATKILLADQQKQVDDQATK